MIYEKKNCALEGCIQLLPYRYEDIRGESVKTFHESTLKKIGINCEYKEDLLVASHKGVFRGMHFQKPPFEQEKFVYCIKGKILDIILDIREGSPTYGKCECIELSSETKNIIYIPKGFAHGYIALEDSIMFYKMSEEYNRQAECGVHWKSLNIELEIKNCIISERDNQFCSLEEFITPFTYIK